VLLSRLRQRDFEVLLELLREVYAIQDLHSFRTQLPCRLQKLVPSEITAYNEVNLEAQHNVVFYDRPEGLGLRQGDQIFDRHIPEHPLIAHSKGRNGHGAIKISDFLSANQFHRLGIYNEFFRQIGIEDQMVISLPSHWPVVIGVALNRDRRNFTERERLLLNLAYPHLLLAYQNAAAWTRLSKEINLVRETLDHSEAAIVILTHAGRVQMMTPAARSLLDKYMPGSPRRFNSVPDLLWNWARRSTDKVKDSVPAPPKREPLTIQHDDGFLSIQLLSGDNPNLWLLELKEVPSCANKHSRLTPREKEVLNWVAQGKTNRDIAEVLSASPRTVQKHLEHIFRKLGVETRTAAAARARDS
jgi:DNA-binding CsgD family transcriptional regulator